MTSLPVLSLPLNTNYFRRQMGGVILLPVFLLLLHACKLSLLNSHQLSCKLSLLNSHQLSCKLSLLNSHQLSCKLLLLNSHQLSCKLSLLNSHQLSFSFDQGFIISSFVFKGRTSDHEEVGNTMENDTSENIDKVEQDSDYVIPQLTREESRTNT
jgi:hypothetical protein